METFFLEKHPHVELCDLLKFMGWCDSGGSAKSVISEGQVKVNGKVETRRRCKIMAACLSRAPETSRCGFSLARMFFLR